MRLSRSITTSAVVLALGGATLLAVGPAQAAPTPLSCPQTPGGFPGDTQGSFIASGVNIRTGPGTDCTSRGQGQAGQSATYHCFVVGHDGHTWTYLTRHGPETTGWVRDTFLSGFGSPFFCP